MNRYENNKNILKEIEKYIDKYPQERFIQILWNMGIINSISNNDDKYVNDIEDRYYEESNITLQKIKNILDTKNI